MGNKSKVGKQRKDKFYHLAKETGYRSRAAFKLLQLNRKYEFLQKSRVLVDLCAAPGGWMQVAKTNMPVSSVVVGVDLFPIKPIPGCISLKGDITTEDCKREILNELKTWKADTVLHDGAPNVGANWLHDAYQQACLVLSALKLSSGILREGGWFVTKVFRSKDYNPLIWVLQQFFKKVHATKPQASRLESAEIFVVCQHYLAPTKIDPKLFDPRHVFQELDLEPKVKLFDTQKPKAEGYSETYSVYGTRVPVSEFLKNESPMVLFQHAAEITFDPETEGHLLNHPLTTDEIKECCKDIKVLGRKDIRNLVSWRKHLVAALLKEKEEEDKKNIVPVETKPEIKADSDSEDDLDEDEKDLETASKEIEAMQKELKKEAKKKKKKAAKERKKLQEKMNLNMIHKNDLGPVEETPDDYFSLKSIKSRKEMNEVQETAPEGFGDSDEESEDERPKKVQYSKDSEYLDDDGRLIDSDDDSDEGADGGDDDGFDSDNEGLGFDMEGVSKNSSKKKKVSFAADSAPDTDNPLITDLMDKRTRKERRLQMAELWFDKDVFKDVLNDEDEEYELEKMKEEVIKKGGKIIEERKKSQQEPSKHSFMDSEDDSEDESDESDLEDKENSLSKKKADREYLPDDYDSSDTEEEEKKVAKKLNKRNRKHTLTEEGLALGEMMIRSKKAKRDIMDAAWNRYAFNDENLPEWFVKDEKEHMRPRLPVSEDLVQKYRDRNNPVNARTIKKVVEAKARKKKQAAMHREKEMKKLEKVMDNPDMSEAEKARQLRQAYKKLKKKKTEIKYVVAKRATAAKRAKRPPGVKGPYKQVDPRMKKDTRAKFKGVKKGKGRKGSAPIKVNQGMKRGKGKKR
ncbi:unnamed protein product [Bemisia tabaci]|uniref:Putative rRNA methyltransferase n=1 Tax=Bemisia tabaci TaxID=7038 RepID=A0A9P0AIE2_BEMTA|nr:unnamed protein product [Bemisia tabaci]